MNIDEILMNNSLSFFFQFICTSSSVIKISPACTIQMYLGKHVHAWIQNYLSVDPDT